MFTERWMIFFIFVINIICVYRVQGFDHRQTITACTANDPQQTNQTFVRLLCPKNAYILVQNVTFGVHRQRPSSTLCTYQNNDCITRTTYIGMECNGLTDCQLDLNPQYLHICSQYSDYMMLDYLCLQGQSLSVCDQHSTSTHGNERIFLRSPNYPHEYENTLDCSCQINSRQASIEFLEFYLEERDEIDQCTRDYLQIDQRSFCDGQVLSRIDLNTSVTRLTFQTNDVITRKGFWLMINSDYPIEISCGNPLSNAIIPPSSSPSSSSSSSSYRYTLSSILLVIILLIILLLLFNLILICLCWKQRRLAEKIDYKSSHFPSNSTPSTSITTGAYDDPTAFLSLPRPCYPIHCHCSEFYRTTSTAAPHIYETIKGSYEQFRQATFHQEEQTDVMVIGSHPETLV